MRPEKFLNRPLGTSPLRRAMAASLMAVLSAAAWAEGAPPAAAPASGPAPEALPTVQSTMQRGSFVPYKRLNELLSKLRTEGEGVFVSRFKLTGANKAEPPPAGTRLVLMNDEQTINIPIDAAGRFDLPTFPEAQARDMELGSNQPKGALAVGLSIDLTTPPELLDMAAVRRAVRLGQHLRGELLPWYVRWMFPQIDGVTICSDRPEWSLEWPENGQTLALPLSADAAAREPETAKGQPSRPCTTLTGQEQWPDRALLKSPVGGNTKLYVQLRQARPS